MNLYQALVRAVGSAAVITDPELTASYERDWSGRYRGRAKMVVRPGNTAEVAAVIAACARHAAAVVPQGGNTGLVGASVPRHGEVVVSTTRLNEIGEIDSARGQVTVGAGVTLAALQDAARSAGEDAALDFASRDSCTVGGVVACDAGGARALRHGTARSHVAGLEAVLADGSVISRLAGLSKDNAGYDLPALLIGSEGTLGIITRVRWKLEPLLPARVAALLPLPSAADAADLLASLRRHAPSLESCDFFLDECLQLVLDHQRRSSPLRERAPLYVLAECAGRSDPTGELVEALVRAGIEDALIADDTAGRERLWALREGHADAISAAGIPHKLDVGVPLDELGRFLDEVPGAVSAAGGDRAILFGHLGDGNVHVNVLGPDPDDTRVDDAVLELVLRCRGTISAEHGIGVAKARWLERAIGAESLLAMRAIKRALDPENVLNPGAGADHLDEGTAPPCEEGDNAVCPTARALRALAPCLGGSPPSLLGGSPPSLRVHNTGDQVAGDAKARPHTVRPRCRSCSSSASVSGLRSAPAIRSRSPAVAGDPSPSVATRVSSRRANSSSARPSSCIAARSSCSCASARSRRASCSAIRA